MSSPEPSIGPVSIVTPQTETKHRPPISQKPSMDLPPGQKDSTLQTSGGKVKCIIDKFSLPDATLAAVEPPTNGASKRSPKKSPKRAPTVKPKPVRTTLQSQKTGDKAPPLPLKRSLILRQQSNQAKKEALKEGEGSGIVANVEGGRSEPDGKEVDLQLIGGVEAEAEHASDTPPSPCCDRDCSCMCHLQRPGMKLVWVPIEEEDEEEQEGDESDGEERGAEGESEAEEEEEEGNVFSGGDETEESGGKLNKAKFHHVLDILMADGSRRLSDPGPQVVLTSFAPTCPGSPPIPPKRIYSSKRCQEEEEDIYEDILVVVEPKPRTDPCRELDLPLIRVRKPARRSKLLSSENSDPTSDQDLALSTDDNPPAIPPRMPVEKSARILTAAQRGGVALPQPTAEEWRSLHPSPPNLCASQVSPQRASIPAPNSPILPVRPPPQPPKTGRDPRRLSNVSVLSNTQAKEQEENGRNEGEKEETTEKHSTLRRGSSIDWESSLQDEPLYQTYRATVITKEIRRQTVCRNISKTSADYPTDWSTRRSGSGPGQSTLWQDLPAVRDSNVLETLSPEQCKYQESMFEVLTSEASYLRSLRVLTEHFLENRDLDEAMIIRDRKTLFSNILRVREVSERFLKDLEDRMDESLVFSDICDIIHYHAQHNFPAYIDYVRNQIYQEKTYTNLIKNNVNFATVITHLQESPLCQRLPFMSFLLLPFQRITRIKMLIENILKRTKEGTGEEQTASKALESVAKIIEVCNTEVGKMKQVEELIHLSKMLEFDKLKAIPIISQTRFLEKKGELQEMVKGATLFSMRGKFTTVHLFLFNDLLIIASKKGPERFVVLDHVHRSLVQVQPLEEDASPSSVYEHCFCLTLLENHQGRMMERMLKAPSQSDMHRWIAAFPNPSNPDGDEEEVIYEDWDCPQVQCVEQYIAQQTDELTLEPTEIINVVRKTSGGWYEGIRLSDGQKGWFPIGNVLEITNEHVKRRNLRERYRVIQAASAVTNNKNR
ncbi:rho guanine nucleotide exchange factor 15 isoform X1 [Hypomesus transpacificus]|uniref:rho guanine nucleotide exchange factor 15 isoform X1 n=1 Tax=Hypomesus transpacificus TaxID=137520 RepID=UPI001F079627|nr:rho guanine nucleotide exchange factor 15 isoform X1 [Hypomesus transpacificus]